MFLNLVLQNMGSAGFEPANSSARGWHHTKLDNDPPQNTVNMNSRFWYLSIGRELIPHIEVSRQSYNETDLPRYSGRYNQNISVKNISFEKRKCPNFSATSSFSRCTKEYSKLKYGVTLVVN
jgi:hypothetical protein